MSIYSHMTCISHFKRVKVAHRFGKTPEEMLALHNLRKERNKNQQNFCSIIQFIKNINRSIITPFSNLASNGTRTIGTHTIPLGLFGSHNMIKGCQNNRIKNWAGTEATWLESHIETKDEGRYSSSCPYTRYSYTRRVESWGHVISPRYLYVRIQHNDGFMKQIIKAPRGYYWSHDSNGIFLDKNNSKNHDYHPTADDFLCFQKGYMAGAKHIINKLNKNYETRKENLRKAEVQKEINKIKNLNIKDKIEYAKKIGCFLSIVDSIKSGNCLAGTINWIERHQLEKIKHYCPSDLPFDNPRVNNVLDYAITRHMRENKQGVCNLADHYITHRY